MEESSLKHCDTTDANGSLTSSMVDRTSCQITTRGVEQFSYLLAYLIRVRLKDDNTPLSQENVEKGIKLIEKYQKCLSRITDYHGLSSITLRINLVPSMIDLVRKAALSHEWIRVLQLVEALTNAVDRPGAKSVVWKAGLTSLIVAKKCKHIDKFARSVYTIKQVSCSEVMLDYVLFLLMDRNFDRLETIPQEIKNYYRYVVSEKQTLHRKHVCLLLNAYLGLGYYMKWKAAIDKTDSSDSETGTVQSVVTTLDNDLAKKAIEKMSVIREHAGVWDIFIDKMVEIHNYYAEYDLSEKLLKQYVTLNPDNPIAHHYLYSFIQEVEGESVVTNENLENIARLDPSNPLVLRLCDLLGKRHPNKTLVLLFDFLDFDHCKDNLEAWQKLEVVLIDGYANKRSNGSSRLKRLWAIFSVTIKNCWSVRKDWWPETVLKVDASKDPQSEVDMTKTRVYKHIQNIVNRILHQR